MSSMLERAQGCLLGQLAGDALGGLVEFQTLERIRRNYPNGVRELTDGGTWNTIAGQPTDDSEMALMLTRTLLEHGIYSQEAVREAYIFWLNSKPFDCGTTISAALNGRLNYESQANGALMRVSPLGIFGANYDLPKVAQWAMLDAQITHPNPVCLQANALFVMALANAIKTGADTQTTYQAILDWAEQMDTEPTLDAVIKASEQAPPEDYTRQQGWVLIAFGNALWQLLHAPELEAGVVDTIMQGGDTDTNAAICGALLGAVHGCEAIPSQWVDRLLNCRPKAGCPGVYKPRPQCFWPVDVLELVQRLITKNP